MMMSVASDALPQPEEDRPSRPDRTARQQIGNLSESEGSNVAVRGACSVNALQRWSRRQFAEGDNIAAWIKAPVILGGCAGISTMNNLNPDESWLEDVRSRRRHSDRATAIGRGAPMNENDSI
jgi:hypothetical protein